MKSIFVDSFNIFSPLGTTAAENYSNVKNGLTGVNSHHRPDISIEPLFASLIHNKIINDALKEKDITTFSRYEKIILCSVDDALKNSDIDPSSSDTLFVFSTTKGNISLLEFDPEPGANQINLMESAEKITGFYKNKNKPVVISNACISGVVALLYARRILETGEYKNVIVTGADCINRFIYSGFSSFQALSANNCKPFSSSRDGINLGEAGATVILSVNDKHNKHDQVKLLNGAITNDSNHISGPSRTGEELFTAIEKAIHLSGINKSDIGFISAHGTATSFNDEMEAKAINLAGLQNTPVNSLKGYFGHTLGAAGLVESVIGIMALQNEELIPTVGYTAPCVEPKVNVSDNLKSQSGMKYFLKTASGFGGCNAALIFSKS